VFKYSDLVEGKFCCEGMINAFYSRYRYVDQNKLEPICQEGDPFFAYPSFFPLFSLHWSHCWSIDLWDSIIIELVFQLQSCYI
jgi:hypothetical protein